MTAGRGHYVELTWTPDFSHGSGRQRKAQRYEAFVPGRIADDEPVLESSTVALAERAGSAVRDLNSNASGLVSLEVMGRQLLRSEALASSQIEGLSISHRKLAEAELEGRHGHHKAKEIMGTIKALERAMEIGGRAGALDVEAIVDIHKELAIVPPLDKIAGQIREEASWIVRTGLTPAHRMSFPVKALGRDLAKNGCRGRERARDAPAVATDCAMSAPSDGANPVRTSWIGGSAPPNAEYVGPPHQEVRPLLDDLCHFMNRDDISPIPQAAIAHAQFELIHPFGDGNGRVGRCLIHVLLRRRGLAPAYVPPISLVLGANKDAYIAGLQGFRAGSTDEWIKQFARGAEIAAERAREFSAEVTSLQESWRELVKPVRSDAAVLPLIDVLPKYPVITAAVAEKEIGRSRPATISALSQLGSVDVLKRHRNQKKGDSWEAKDLFQLLSSFEESVRLPAA